ncbi:MAG TPA: alpha/beta hydrolase, partial [Tepidiformaceae bacterium]|nr:alpha/beta hydrolase [Tepidiformaceae bacterium]
MAEITHRTIQTNGINMHIAEAGSGPLVVMCHGWPESWYSWRHQLTALADAGYHAVAPDQRGYGQTDKPEAIDQYTQFHLVGDIVGLLDALGEETAVVAGHDWGAPVAWNCALLRPDRFPAVIALSVPYLPRQKSTAPAGADMGWGGPVRPTDAMRQGFGDRFFYQLYFQTPGVAEHEFQNNVRRTMKLILYGAGGEGVAARAAQATGELPPNTAFMLEGMIDPPALPAWLTDADIDFYANEFKQAGFRGGLNWYRNIDRNWELMGAFAGSLIQQPALFITGDLDVVHLSMARAAVDNLE